MPTTFVTDAVLLDRLAGWYREREEQLPNAAPNTVTDSNLSAYYEIVGRLTTRGYTLAQVATWDRRDEFNRDIGLYWCLVKLANLEASDTWVNKLDRREELDTVVVTIDGEAVTPDDSSGGAVGWGELSTANDLITMDQEW